MRARGAAFRIRTAGNPTATLPASMIDRVIAFHGSKIESSAVGSLPLRNRPSRILRPPLHRLRQSPTKPFGPPARAARHSRAMVHIRMRPLRSADGGTEDGRPANDRQARRQPSNIPPLRILPGSERNLRSSRQARDCRALLPFLTLPKETLDPPTPTAQIIRSNPPLKLSPCAKIATMFRNLLIDSKICQNLIFMQMRLS